MLRCGVVMKKAARLAWVGEVFGEKYVLPHVVTQRQQEVIGIWECLTRTHRKYGAYNSLGIRTDLRDREAVGMKLPFLYQADLRWQVSEFLSLCRDWETNHGQSLEYIVAVGIRPEEDFHNCVALRGDERGTYLLEWDNGGCSQREMENMTADQLHSCGCSPFGDTMLWYGNLMRARSASHFHFLGWPEVFQTAWAIDADEVTFTKTRFGVVIW